MNQQQLLAAISNINILKMQIADLEEDIRESGCEFITCYPGEDEEVKFLKSIDAVCTDHWVSISNWDGYGSRWALTAEQYVEYESWLESQD